MVDAINVTLSTPALHTQSLNPTLLLPDAPACRRTSTLLWRLACGPQQCLSTIVCALRRHIHS